MEMWLRFARALEEDGPLLVGWREWLPLEHVLVFQHEQVQRLELLWPFYHHEGDSLRVKLVPQLRRERRGENF